MRFGKVPVDKAEGAVLAHAVIAPGLVFKKARMLSAADLDALRQHGVSEVVAVRFEPGDVPENEAAAKLAAVVAGEHVRVGSPFTGRANLHALARGVLVLDQERIETLNQQDEAITLGTLPSWSVVEPGQMVATVKIIPFAAPADALAATVALAAESPLVRIAPFRAKRYRLIQTRLAGTNAKMLDKTVRVTSERVRGVDGELVGESRCAHEAEALAAEIRRAPSDWDILLIAGASAITDRRDVLPAGIVAAGGRIRHFGMPVDPGNLLLLTELDGRSVLGLPGCCRSPKLNGFDWVLQRLAADIEVTSRDIQKMGIGGLLMEIPSRPQPREEPAGKAASQPETREEPTESRKASRLKVAALVLAAGQSRRMGERNKLLIDVDGRPMLRHAVEAALGAGMREVLVVTGHERERVEAALAGLPVRFVHNPDYAQGLSTSLRAGIGALSRKLDGAIVLLGDMPRVTADHLRQLVAAFNPIEGRGIVVPTHRGKRGNPVLWSSTHFAAMRELEGDVGARHLIGQHEGEVVEVELDDDAPLLDVDTPAALTRLTGAAA